MAHGGTADAIWGSGDVTSSKYVSAGGGIDKFGASIRRGSTGGVDGEASASPVPEGTRRSSRRRGSDGDQTRAVVSPPGPPPPPGSHLTSSPPTDVDVSPSTTPPPSYMEVTAGGDFVPVDGGEGVCGRQQLPGSPAGRESPRGYEGASLRGVREQEEGNGSRRGSQYGAEVMAAGEQEGVEDSLRGKGLGHGHRVVTVDLYRPHKKERRALDQRRRDRSEPLADICLSSPSLSPRKSPPALSPADDPLAATSFTAAASATSEAAAGSTAPAVKADVSYARPTCPSAGGGADEASGGGKKWAWHGVPRPDGSGGSGSRGDATIPAKAAIAANSLMITTDNQGYVRVYSKEALLEMLSRRSFASAIESKVENGRAGGAGEGSSSGDRGPRRLQ